MQLAVACGSGCRLPGSGRARLLAHRRTGHFFAADPHAVATVGECRRLIEAVQRTACRRPPTWHLRTLASSTCRFDPASQVSDASPGRHYKWACAPSTSEVRLVVG